MRKFVPAFVAGCCVVLWEALLQFGTVQTTLAALRSSGHTGAFMAKFLSSQIVILAIAIAAVLLALRGMFANRKPKSSSADGPAKASRTVNQTMTNSPNSIQAGRDVKK
jgi:hypothetical protein